MHTLNKMRVPNFTFVQNSCVQTLYQQDNNYFFVLLLYNNLVYKLSHFVYKTLVYKLSLFLYNLFCTNSLFSSLFSFLISVFISEDKH